MTAVLVVGAGGGAWVWSANAADAVGQLALATQRADAVVEAEAADSTGHVALDAEAAGTRTAAVLAQARAALRSGVDTARGTLAATDGAVSDDATRQVLARHVAAAELALAASDPAGSPDTASAQPSPTPDPTAAARFSASELRAMTAALAAAEATVAAAHDSWMQEQAAAAAAARAKATTPAPSPSSSAPSCATTYTGPPFYPSLPTVGGDGSNGKLPPSALVAVSWATDSHGTPYYLRTDAAAALERLDVAFRAAFGHHLDLDLTYRDYETQVAMRAALGTVAAVPGTSTHGTGLALDVPELPCEYGWGTAQRTWLVTNGPSFGWTSPSWARQHGSNPEYWHFDYVG